MRNLLPLLLIGLLPACGMKGDLYEPPPAATTDAAPSPGTSDPTPADPDKGERKTVPSTPDPAKSL